MDIRQIACVMEIAKSRSITRAAENLYLTRSSLNYMLLNLEKELGAQLFHRTPGGMVPNSAGEVFLSYARRITEDMSRMQQAVGEFSQTEICHLRVGVTVGGGQRILMKILPELLKSYPNCRLRVMEGNCKQLQRYLLDNSIDIAWSGPGDQPPQLDCIFTRDPVRVLLGVPNTLVEKYHLDPGSGEPVDLRLFRDEPFVVMNANSFISDITDSYFYAAEFKPSVIMECSLMSMAATFVKNGLALAFLTEGTYQPDDTFSMFSVEPQRTVRSSIFFRKGTQFTKAEQFLIELVKASMAEGTGFSSGQTGV